MSFTDLLLLAKSGRQSSGPSSSLSSGARPINDKLYQSTPMFMPSTNSSLLDDDKLLSDDYLNWSRSKRDQEDEFLHLELFEDFAAKIKASVKADEKQSKGKMKLPRTILDDPEFLEEYPEPPPPKPKIATSRDEHAQPFKDPVKRRLFMDDDDDDDKEVAIEAKSGPSNSDDADELIKLRRENEFLREENALMKRMLANSDAFKFAIKSLSSVIRERHAMISDRSHVTEDADTPFSLAKFAKERNSEKSDSNTLDSTLSFDVTRKLYANGSAKESFPGGFTTLRMKNGDSYMNFPSGKRVFIDSSKGIRIADTGYGVKEVYDTKTGQYECHTKGLLHEAYFEDTSYTVEKKDEFCISVKSLDYPLVTIESPDGSTVLVQPDGNVSLMNK